MLEGIVFILLFIEVLFTAQCMMASFQLKALAKSVSRLRNLESYCSNLLQCNTTVSHSTEVIQFFLPNEQELMPEYTQNR